MSQPSDQATQSNRGGLVFLFAFALAPMLVIVVLGVDSANPIAIGVGFAFLLMLLMMAGLLALCLWLLADCPEVSVASWRLYLAAGRPASASPAPMPAQRHAAL